MKVYFVNVSMIDEKAYGIFLNMVSQERREKCLAYRKFDDAKRSVCSEMLLKYALNQLYNQNIEPDIRYNRYGKPYLYNLPGFHYNISHSGDWVVMICGDKEVGIDIEIIQEPSQGMVDEFFSDKDIAYINNGLNNEKEKRFTETWTLKESYIKYVGTGLSMDLNSFYIDISGNQVYDLINNKKITLFFESFIWDQHYYVAMCTLEKNYYIEKVSPMMLLHLKS